MNLTNKNTKNGTPWSAAALLLLTAAGATAQTIPNPSFETDTFTEFPGYISGNAAITGWEATKPDRSGLNPAAGSPFASNGAIPSGTKVAFLQSSPGTGDTILRTTVTGLTAGTKYKVNFRMNARTAELPFLKVFTDGTGDPVAMRVSPVGGTAPYRYGAFEFTATAASHVLSLQNFVTAGDHTVVVDDFSITPSSGAWSYSPWTGDATSSVLNTHTYSHAFTFGATAVDAVVNGVPFTPRTGIDPSVSGALSTSGFSAAFGDTGRNLTGDSASVGKSFVYGGPAAMNITLSGLKPNTQYVATIYGVAFDLQPFARAATFSSSLTPDDRLTVDLDQYNQNNGIRVDYAYTTDATGSPVTLTYLQTGDGSFHTSAVSNREALPMVNVAPTVTRNPASGTAELGGTFTFTSGATGSGPLTYQWQRNNTDVPNATSPTLTLTGLTANEQGTYKVIVTNGTSSATSTEATLTVLDGVPGLYDTGVAGNYQALPGAKADPHYLLLVNPDGDSLISAIVEENAFIPGAWLPNAPTSKWVGPRADTTQATGETVDAGAGTGVYVYRTTFDLTGFDLSTVTISGGWATDNAGLSIRVNDTAITSGGTSAGFGSLTTFTINSGNAAFVDGINTLDFYVKNETIATGYTGLRVSGLKGFGTIPAGTAPYIAYPPVDTALAPGSTGFLSVAASGSGPLTYQWYRNDVLIPNQSAAILPLDASAPGVTGNYKVVVTNSVNSATSAVVVVSLLNAAPVAVTDGFATSKDTAATIAASTLTANDTDGEGNPLTVTGVSAASTAGGTVVLATGSVTYTPAAAFTGNDSFTYTVEDGAGGTATGTVQVAVVDGAIPVPGEFIYSSTPTSQQFRFLGVAGTEYHFERSTDLTVWTDVTVATAPVTGIIEFSDANPPAGRAFYRITH